MGNPDPWTLITIQHQAISQAKRRTLLTFLHVSVFRPTLRVHSSLSLHLRKRLEVAVPVENVLIQLPVLESVELHFARIRVKTVEK